MPSVWFINPRIVANLKALATRDRGGEGARRRTKKERRDRRERRTKKAKGGGEEAKTRGRESTQDLGR